MSGNTVSNCKKCGAMGMAQEQVGRDILMECPKDGRKWWTKSSKCTNCGKVTGFPVPGLCPDCYSKR